MSSLPPKNAERDRQICRLYSEGKTFSELSHRFKITRSRIQQIVKIGGASHGKLSKRGEFLGVNLTESVKRSLKDEAEKRGLSMSNLTSQTITEMLTSLGYKVVQENGQPTVVEEP